MKKTLLCGALLGVLGLAQTAVAQEYDDRWYVSGDLGVVLFDGDRDVHDDALYSVGFGKMFAPNWSWEVNLHSTNPNKNSNNHLNWSMWGAGLTGRYHFIREDRSWHPFLYFGAGALPGSRCCEAGRRTPGLLDEALDVPDCAWVLALIASAMSHQACAQGRYGGHSFSSFEPPIYSSPSDANTSGLYQPQQQFTNESPMPAEAYVTSSPSHQYQQQVRQYHQSG